ncbi:MAG: LytR C-terminal domain-containing protein [Nocardioides sp.]|nr:LytR C-terminal domain-containing protein [Nocardioides sp.]
MTPGMRSGLTLATLVALVVVGGTWGWAALTQPFPKEEEVPICVDTQVSAGDVVLRDQVVVSVFNGTRRRNLAGQTQDLLVERGFVAGTTDNAPKQVRRTEIWADDPDNPAVALVKRQFRRARVVSGDALGPGVVVVVGSDFEELRKKKVERVKAKTDATFCKATSAD